LRWIEVKVAAPLECEEALYAALYETGAGGLRVDDPNTGADADRATALWDAPDENIVTGEAGKSAVRAYYGAAENLAEKLSLLAETLQKFLGGAETSIETQTLDETDWENVWKIYYKPLTIGNITIKPTWEPLPPDAAAHVIEMDPGMAFGTGTHETTRLCVKLLQEYLKKGARILDIGTGSGILAICAALLGADKVSAVDIDPNAARVARENIALNHLSEKIGVFRGDLTETVLEGETFDFIAANIIADAIVRVTPQIPPLLSPDGLFLASGVIDLRTQDVERTLAENGFEIIEKRVKNDWVAFLARYAG
jgi:ribosomal protein L11 methyltransferase